MSSQLKNREYDKERGINESHHEQINHWNAVWYFVLCHSVRYFPSFCKSGGDTQMI
jgi:hypothetical protein